MSVRKELDDYLAAMTEAGEKGDPTYHWLFLHGFKHALEMVDAYWSGDQPVSSQPERPNIESIHRPSPPPAAVPLPRGIDTDAYAKALEADRILREEICNRSDDGDAPMELSERTKTIISTHGWLAS